MNRVFLAFLLPIAIAGCTIVQVPDETTPETSPGSEEESEVTSSEGAESSSASRASSVPVAGPSEQQGSGARRAAASPGARPAKAQPAAAETTDDSEDDRPTAKEAIAEMAKLRDELCACTDEPCVKGVMERAKQIKEPTDLTEDDLKEVFEIAMAMEKCAKEAVAGDGVGGDGGPEDAE